MDVDEKPDGPALAAGETAATPASNEPPRFTKEGHRILKEMPIFFTTEMAEYLTLLQYPHRLRTDEHQAPELPLVALSQRGQPVYARMKPKVGALEISIPIEGPDKDSYALMKGIDMGAGLEATDLGAPAGAPSRKRGAQSVPEHKHELRRMTLRAEHLADQTNYCAGLLQADGLHLTPLTSTMQLRAHLSYLDHNQARVRERKGRHEENEEHSANEDSEEEGDDRAVVEAKKKKLLGEQKPESKAISVSIKSDQSGGDKGVGRATAALFAPYKAEQQEPWVDLAYYSRNTDEANSVAGALTCHSSTRLDCLMRTTENLTVLPP